MSSSTDSINGDDDPTADQDQVEHLWPNVANLSPSEEMRLLLDRIAQLKRQQSTNSPASSSSSAGGFDLVAQNGGKRPRIEGDQGGKPDELAVEECQRITKLEFENKALRAELGHHKDIIKVMKQNMELQSDKMALLERLFGLKQKQTAHYEQQKADQKARHALEEYQKQQQQAINEWTEKLKVDYFSQLQTTINNLDQQKLLNAMQTKMEEYQNKQQHNIHAKMEKYQKGQQQTIDDLQKTVAVLNATINEKGLTPQNKWNGDACHESLALIGSDRLSVQFTGEGWVPQRGSVFAQEQIPKNGFGIFYYEVKILGTGMKMLAIGSGVHVGLGTKKMQSNDTVGHYDGTYAYENDGLLWGHAVEGCFHDRNGRPYVVGKHKFGVGDVVGCGVNLATRQIIYAKNGQPLETANLFVTSTAKLVPCVSLLLPDAKIEANFGPNFEYKF